MAESTEELQAQVDEFDNIYNNLRPHQALPGRVTPQQAWDAMPVAEPPKPRTADSIPSKTPIAIARHQQAELKVRTTKVRADGTIRVKNVEYKIGIQYAGQVAYVKTTGMDIEFSVLKVNQ